MDISFRAITNKAEFDQELIEETLFGLYHVVINSPKYGRGRKLNLNEKELLRRMINVEIANGYGELMQQLRNTVLNSFEGETSKEIVLNMIFKTTCLDFATKACLAFVTERPI